MDTSLLAISDNQTKQIRLPKGYPDLDSAIKMAAPAFIGSAKTSSTGNICQKFDNSLSPTLQQQHSQ